MEIKIEVLFKLHNKDFSQSIGKHYTTVDRLTNGQDTFDYANSEIIAKRQFTGVLDCDSVEIYEGDIVQWGDDVNEVVIFDDGSFCTQSSMLCKSTMKIIGNTYQNPELIK